MKKITLLFVLALAMNSWSQEYMRMIRKGTYSVQEIQEKAEAYFAEVGTGRGVGYKPYKRWEYNALRSMDQNGMLKSSEFIEETIRQYRQENNLAAKAAFQGSWEELGPESWNQTSSWSPGLGRVTSIGVDVTNTNHMIIGSPTGGVWKTTNGGVKWHVLTDNRTNLDVYSLVIHPTNPQIYFWGSTAGRIYKSTDGGATWPTSVDIGNGTVNKIIIDPTTPTKMYCSSQEGGLFKSVNSGASWTLIHPAAVQGYDVEFKPGNFNTIYAVGNHLFMSVDGGNTFTVPSKIANSWTQEYVSGQSDWVTSTGNENNSITPKTGNGMATLFIDSSSNPITRLVSPVINLTGAILPKLNFSYANVNWFGDIDHLAVLYKTSAGGAWNTLATYTAQSAAWSTNSITLPNPNGTYYIAFEGRSKYGRGITLDDVSITTTNLGTPFQDGFEVGASFFGLGPKMLGVSSVANANVIYTVEAAGGKFGGFHKSINGGSTFTKLNHTKNYFAHTYDGSGDSGQAPRDMDIAIDPVNSDIVYIAGVNMWKSTNGGTSFSIIAHWNKNVSDGNNKGYCHADIDILEFINNDLYAGTDGGLFVAKNPNNVISTSYFEDLTQGVGVKQFYRIGVSQTNPEIVTGGSQDNGSAVYDGNTGVWKDWLGADGMEGFVDKTNSSILYGTSQNGVLYKSINGGNSYNYLNIPEDPDKRGKWVTPFEQDPTVANTIYSAYDKVYKSTNGGVAWSAISQVFEPNANAALTNMDELKIAPSNNQVLYAAKGANIYRTGNGGSIGNWVNVKNNLSGNINSIAIHPTNPDKVAVAVSGGNVYLTENGGGNWTNIKHNLPNLTAYTVAWHGNADNGLYVGMYYGVYYIDDTFIANTTYWQDFSNNIPNVRVYELEVNTANNKLYAGTYGRGLWKSDLYNPALSIAEEEFQKLSVFPNPAKNILNISWDKKEKATIKIFSLTGDIVYYSKGQDLFNTYKINTTNLATGVYFVKVNTVRANVVKKIIIE